MAWTLFGREFTTSEATDLTIHQKFKFNKKRIVRIARCWYIFYGQPTFTNIQLKFYTNTNDQPDLLIATSTNMWLPSGTYTAGNNGAAKEIYFEFNYPAFLDNEYYHAVTNISGYTNVGTSHISWKSTFPDPPYKDGVTLDYNFLNRYPLDLTFIGDELK